MMMEAVEMAVEVVVCVDVLGGNTVDVFAVTMLAACGILCRAS